MSRLSSSSAHPGNEASPGGDGPLGVYKQKLQKGELNTDPQQERVVERLQKLHSDLKTYQPRKATKGWFSVRLVYFCHQPLEKLVVVVVQFKEF